MSIEDAEHQMADEVPVQHVPFEILGTDPSSENEFVAHNPSSDGPDRCTDQGAL